MSNIIKIIVYGRLNYPNIWEPKSINGSEPKYSISLIIPKDDKKTLAIVKQAIEEAKEEGISKLGWKNTEDIVTPLKDGDVERPNEEAYENGYFLNVTSNEAPYVVNARVKPILDKSEIYSGCYGNLSLYASAYSVDNSTGVTFFLGNVQKVRDGQPIRNHSKAEDDFEVIEEEDFLL